MSAVEKSTHTFRKQCRCGKQSPQFDSREAVRAWHARHVREECAARRSAAATREGAAKRRRVPRTLWTNDKGGCLNAVLASLVDVHPVDVPHDLDDGRLDLERLNAWLEPQGRRLVPVHARGTWGESYPSGDWIALLYRTSNVMHAVLARGNEITHDPSVRNGRSGHLSPDDLAYAHNPDWPLGFRVDAV
jgi:hypothetical protein